MTVFSSLAILGAKAPNLHVDTCIYVPGAESCQKSLARKGRGFALTQEAAYNLKYAPELAVLIEKIMPGSCRCTVLSLPGQSWGQSVQEAPSPGVTAFNQASASSPGGYDSPSPSLLQCQLVKLFYQVWQWAVSRVWTDTVPQVRGVGFQPRGGNL